MDIYTVALVLGLILSIFVFIFDEVFSFEGPFNFSVLVTFMTVLGGVGSLLTYYGEWEATLIAAIAMLSGLVIALLFDFLYLKPMREAENSMAFSIHDLVGQQGEIITPIGIGKYGEVLVKMTGGYTSQIAASTLGEEIPKNEMVRVDRIEEGVLYVSLF
jgi:hypothetical protein